jgi:prepilin-type N-terminal cleavage/methylation domain-containing protein
MNSLRFCPRHRPGHRPRRGFTLVELLAATLVLSLGIATAVTVVLYGMRLTQTANGRNTGLPTAMSVAVDQSPIVGAGSSWTVAGYNASGWINSYYVTRTETIEAVQPTLPNGISAATVTVTVSTTQGGPVVCTYSQRILRETPK